MSASVATRQTVLTLLSELRRREDGRVGRRVVAVRARPEWTDDAEFESDGEPVTVAAGTSPLAVRAAIAEPREPTRWLVLLTELTEHELGVEVVARLARRRVEFLDPWTAVQSAFGLQGVDPLLRATPEIAEVLLRHRPTHGYPRVPGSVLTRDHALDAICAHALQLPDLADRGAPWLLSWLATTGAGTLWAALPAGVQREVAAWWVATAGAVGEIASTLLGNGAERNAIAYGLAADVIAASGELQAAGFLAAKLGDADAARHFAAYGAAAREADDPTGNAATQAELLLTEAKALHAAIHSDVLTAGFEQRLAAVGQALATARTDPIHLDVVETAIDCCRRHRRANVDYARIAAAEGALRLVRFLDTTHGDPPKSLSEAAQSYRSVGAWVDRARTSMRRGEVDEHLIAAYQAIDADVAERREGENQRFGELAANWVETGGTLAGIVPVEKFITAIVAPLATAPVLVIVLDGASLAIWTELAESVQAAGWMEVIPEPQTAPPCGLATVPSVTRFSRTSLLSGTLADGTAKDEAKAFPAALAGVSKGAPARLFHKSEMTASGGAAISNEVASAIVDPKIRVVGVVINEVDDSLSGGTQADRTWTINAITPLQACLAAAISIGRTVVITSDHGHVVDYEVSHASGGKGGERYRDGNSNPEDGELRVDGERVLTPGHVAVVPWTETRRYSTTRSAGYHGGITPQEMLTPLAVLVPAGTAKAGWRAVDLRPPEWW